jgi:hypothetical protein
MNDKFNYLALIGLFAVFMSCLFLVEMRNLFQGHKILQIEWDMATNTAGDYTVECGISKEEYNSWLRDNYSFMDSN